MKKLRTTKNNIIFQEKLMEEIKSICQSYLLQKYNCTKSFYDTKKINEILQNKQSKYVGAFKEYLIYEDYTEFLKQYFNKTEVEKIIPKILIFYKEYCKIYPNYIPLEESKYIYRNIKRKQKIIYQLQGNKDDKYLKTYSTIITTQALNSINENTLTISNKITNTKEDEDVNKLINNIKYYEELKENNTKKIEIGIKNKVNNVIKNNSRQKYMNSALLSPTAKSKLFEKNNALLKVLKNNLGIENENKQVNTKTFLNNFNIKMDKSVFLSSSEKRILSKRNNFHPNNYSVNNSINNKEKVCLNINNIDSLKNKIILNKIDNLKHISAKKISFKNNNELKNKSTFKKKETSTPNFQNSQSQLNILHEKDLKKKILQNSILILKINSFNSKTANNSPMRNLKKCDDNIYKMNFDFRNIMNKKNEFKKKIPLSDRNHLKNNNIFDNLLENRNLKNKNLMNIHKKDTQLFNIVMKKFHSYKTNKIIPGNDIINYKKIRYLSPNQRKIIAKDFHIRTMIKKKDNST